MDCNHRPVFHETKIRIARPHGATQEDMFRLIVAEMKRGYLCKVKEWLRSKPRTEQDLALTACVFRALKKSVAK